MICPRCMLRAARPNSKIVNPIRAFSNSSQRAQKTITSDKVTSAPRQGSPDSHQPPAATSTSAAQPFSTPLTPSPANAGVKPGKKATSPSPVVLSSVTAGTPLKGLNFLKNGSDPVALADEEYPPWLWTILTPKVRANAVNTELDEGLYSNSKTRRRKAEKERRKQGLLNPESLVPKVPLQEQTVDLPTGDGTLHGALEAGAARDNLTKAMRQKRRATIKEANFLKAMG
ncbi:hypothetical protein NA57DRAFT_55529 [Rhizodiscina lignyota]|uniref:Large ribosomal subunit protein mL54 n=1 Tax=Rhizodiscina lignyota TaxID=1504668 RepID=A0A9P4IEQ8_9PEZI|nr:hypothetical protein NA57DRAFT_55529 [Rhizodiscina lignyota]